MENPQNSSQGQLVSVPLPISRPLLTYVLLASIILVFVAQLITDQLSYPQQPLLRLGGVERSRILSGEYYRLFTAMFLHVNPAHIFFNGLALWSFGQTVERFFGHTRFIVIYLLGGLCGSIASFLFTQRQVIGGISVVTFSVGASAAIFAILGAEMIFLFHNRQILGQGAQRELRSLLTLALINFGIGVYSQFAPGGGIIDNWGHIGGFIAGIVLAWFMAPLYHLRADLNAPAGYSVEDKRPSWQQWLATLVFAVLLVFVLFYAVNTVRR